MSYRFNGSSDYVEFDKAPFASTTFGAATIACFLKRSSTGNFDALVNLSTSTFSERMILYLSNSDLLYTYRGSSPQTASHSITSTSLWYLVVATFAAGGSAVPRLHVHNGTSWSHLDAAGSLGGSDFAVAGTDKLVVGRTSSGSFWLGGDVVCAGIKKTSSTDLQVETLSRTSFAAWAAFGFDWLVGFDTSLQSAGVLQDQASPGTGDQVAISGTSVVADPPGWSYALATTPVADFTGTPLTGVAPYTVTFTDASTNTPTSWAWTFGDGGTSTAQNPTHSYTVPGVYTVVLVATNAAGSNTKTRTAYVTVTAAFVPQIAIVV